MRRLREAGYDVLMAASGEQAIRMSDERSAEISLLLTDVVMPRTSGTELRETLTRSRPHLKVLHMSGYLEDDLRTRVKSNYETQFIQKPFTRESLIRTVGEILHRN